MPIRILFLCACGMAVPFLGACDDAADELQMDGSAGGDNGAADGGLFDGAARPDVAIEAGGSDSGSGDSAGVSDAADTVADAGEPDVGPDAGPKAQVFNTRAGWSADVCVAPRMLNFDGPTEMQGLATNAPAIQPSYESRGVVFGPFLGSQTYPVIYRNQSGQIRSPGTDGLLANISSPAPVSNLAGRAIRASFPIPVNAVGLSFNQGDGGRLDAFDGADNLIATAPITAGGFGGIVSARAIARIEIVNEFDRDITAGIYGFSYCMIEP